MNVALPAREHGYEVFDAIASGGMAVVHLGRRRGAAGFARVVAVKRLHAHLADDPDLVAMLIDEARLSARVRHANVVSVLDVIDDGGLALVMEYVHGASLSDLMREASKLGERVPRAITSAIVIGALSGLHAAHEARGEDGEPLGLVHRDVSPQNILVGTDGTARIVDFGIAKARVRSHVTRDGTLKGKLAYMAPEQLTGKVTRRTDLLAAGLVLWELFAGKRFYEGVHDEAHMIGALSMRAAPPLAPLAPDLPEAAVQVVERALRKDPEERFATAEEMAHALQDAVPPAPPRTVGAWVERVVGARLARRAAMVARIERGDRADDDGAAVTSAPSPSAAAAPSPEAARGDASTRVERPGGATPGQGVAGAASGAAMEPGGAVTMERGTVTMEHAGTVTMEHAGTVTIDPAVRRAESSQRRARLAWWAGSVAVVLGVAGAAVLGARAVGGSPPAAGGDVAEGDVKYTKPAGQAPAGTAEPAGTPANSLYPEPSDRAPAAAEKPVTSSPGAAPSPPSPLRGAGPAPKPSASAAKPLPGCDPPWELDAQGIKRVKRACLK